MMCFSKNGLVFLLIVFIISINMFVQSKVLILVSLVTFLVCCLRKALFLFYGKKLFFLRLLKKLYTPMFSAVFLFIVSCIRFFDTSEIVLLNLGVVAVTKESLLCASLNSGTLMCVSLWFIYLNEFVSTPRFIKLSVPKTLLIVDISLGFINTQISEFKMYLDTQKSIGINILSKKPKECISLLSDVFFTATLSSVSRNIKNADYLCTIPCKQKLSLKSFSVMSVILFFLILVLCICVCVLWEIKENHYCQIFSIAIFSIMCLVLIVICTYAEKEDAELR